MHKIFLVVSPGIEQLAINEIQQHFPKLVQTNKEEKLEFECKLETIYKLNILLRIPNRILVRMAEFEATTFQDLFQKAVRLPWKQFIKKDTKI
jgi:putative N6-adenine-specific DNA methylase